MKKIFLFVIASVWALGMSAQNDVKGTTEFGINLGYDFGQQRGGGGFFSLQPELGKHFSCDYIEKINAVDLMADNSSIGQMGALWDELSNENRQAMLTFAYCLIFDQNKDENMEKSIENSKWMLNEAKDMMKLRKERQKARERYEYRKEKGLSVAEHIELYEEQWKACEECGRENCEGCKWKDIK